MINRELLIPTKIIKSKRKSISLTIKNNGDFIVHASIYARDEDIVNFINKKAEWIIKKRIIQSNSPFTPLTFNKVEKITLLGNTYDIKYHTLNNVKIVDNELYLPECEPKSKLISFMKRNLKKHISERLDIISTKTNLTYSNFSISSARTCWGSCSFNNRLHFTYKLLMCPPEVIDYIILHELCHTRIKNHSKEYWNMVASYLPNYKSIEKWLKENRGIIEIV